MKKKSLLLLLLLLILFFCPLSSTKAKTITVSNINEMIHTNALPGSIINTNGYLSPNDNGAASYTVTSSIPKTIDNCIYFKLENGNYAQLMYSHDSIVNVACFGIFPDKSISKELNYMISSLTNNVAGIIFNQGTYILDSPIYLEPLHYYGNDSILAVSDSFETKYDIIVTTTKSKCKEIDIRFDSISFFINSSSTHSMSQKETQLLVLSQISTCEIVNCNFIANAGQYMPIDLVWFKNCENVNTINIENCTFQNNSGYNTINESHLIGGCLWFSGKNEFSSYFENISITSCYFTTSVSDEALCFWYGIYQNIIVKNCAFTNQYHTSDNLLAFNKAIFYNTLLENCNFTIHKSCEYIIKLNGRKDSNITFSSSTFVLNTEINAPWTNQCSLFKCTNNSQQGTVNYLLDNCSITSTSDTIYRSIFSVQNTSNINIYINNNCFFCSPTDSGILWCENSSSINIFIEDSHMDFNSRFSNQQNTTNVTFNISQCTINSKITSVISGYSSINLYSTQNTVLSNPVGTLLYAYNLSDTSPLSNINITRNKIVDKNFSIFNSNTNLTSKDIINELNTSS